MGRMPAMKRLLGKGTRVLSRLAARRVTKFKGIAVSVIVPVYNTETYLRQMLDSVVAQDLATENFEVIAVDDGSTDASGRILDEYAERFSNFRVVHQANSGWAGKPRNVALGLSQGKFVFFADADDLLEPHALRRMVEFAEQHRLDVVLPKVVGIGGRKQTSSLYARTNPSITPLQALKSLTPQKLVARSLIESNNLRFAEEPIRLEDGIFMVACYLLANGIGVIADSDFYSLRQRADGSNISYRPLVPHEYTSSIAKIAVVIKAMATEPDLAESMIIALWRRKGLKIYEPPRFKRYSEKVQDQWLEAHSNFLEEFMPVELSGRMSAIHHRKTEAIRRKDKTAVLATNVLEAMLTQPATVTSAAVTDGCLKIAGMVAAPGIDTISLSVEARGKRDKILAGIVLPVKDGMFVGDMSGLVGGEVTLDFFAQTSVGELPGPNRRLVAEDSGFATNGLFEPYRTKNGYLSVRNIGEEVKRS